MEVRIDGQALGSVVVGATTLTTYSVHGCVSAGSHQVSIAFTNDYSGAGGDRNLYVQQVTISTISTNSTSTLISLPATTMTTKTTGASACNGACWNLWSDGYVAYAVNFPSAGLYTFNIDAYAVLAQGIGANM